MSFIPVFKIGLWNAWILMVIFLAATTFLPPLINKEKMEKWMEGEPTGSELNRRTKIVHRITHLVIMPFTLIYSIFLPFKLGTLWFSIGLPICLLATVICIMFTISYITAPLGRPITKGVYAFSRHPGYFGFFLLCVGIGIACASWVFLLCALAWIVTWNFGIGEEERILLEKYGDPYREYMNRTPRWIGFSKRR
jgi:protein-S-isoprenylcysteine O-methyltransferase Ste14